MTKMTLEDIPYLEPVVEGFLTILQPGQKPNATLFSFD
jgi:hypothetical protein